MRAGNVMGVVSHSLISRLIHMQSLVVAFGNGGHVEHKLPACFLLEILFVLIMMYMLQPPPPKKTPQSSLSPARIG